MDHNAFGLFSEWRMAILPKLCVHGRTGHPGRRTLLSDANWHVQYIYGVLHLQQQGWLQFCWSGQTPVDAFHFSHRFDCFGCHISSNGATRCIEDAFCLPHYLTDDQASKQKAILTFQYFSHQSHTLKTHIPSRISAYPKTFQNLFLIHTMCSFLQLISEAYKDITKPSILHFYTQNYLIKDLQSPRIPSNTQSAVCENLNYNLLMTTIVLYTIGNLINIS